MWSLGLSLAKDQWMNLMSLSNVIDEAIEQVQQDRVGSCSLQHEKRIPVEEERTIAFAVSSFFVYFRILQSQVLII